VQAAEARAGIGGDILEAKRLDHVDHEVRARTLDDDVAGEQLLRLLDFCGLRYDGGGGANAGCTLEKVAAFHCSSSSRTRAVYSRLLHMEELRS
jgi:hypothetical protein